MLERFGTQECRVALLVQSDDGGSDAVHVAAPVEFEPQVTHVDLVDAEQ